MKVARQSNGPRARPWRVVRPERVTALAGASHAVQGRSSAPGGDGLHSSWLAGLLIVHIFLGIGCKLSALVAVVHALGTLLFGIYLLARWRGPFPLICWVAYVVGSEVLWRMAQSPLPWMYAQYMLSLVLVLGIARSGMRRLPWIPATYFCLLLPALAVTLTKVPLLETRKLFVFNLSGPLTVMLCALFCSRLKLNDRRMRQLMLCVILPVGAIAAAALLGLSTTEVKFDTESNFAATGGFGPNQVSCILGLGALYALLLTLESTFRLKLRVAFLSLALWFAAHAALSFSRSGLYLLGCAVLAAVPFLPLKRLLRPGVILTLCFAVVAGFATWGYLVRFTGGKISERFAQADLSNRDSVAREELQLWSENFVLGAGVGMSAATRAERSGGRVASHTEYTRLLSEHGVFGLFAGLLLLAACYRPLTSSLPTFTKAAVVASLLFALLYFAVSGMRTTAPGFLYGLAFAGPILTHRSSKRQRKQSPTVRHWQPFASGSAGQQT